MEGNNSNETADKGLTSKIYKQLILLNKTKQGEKTTLRMGENNSNETTDKGLIPKYTSSSYNSIPEKQTTQSKSEKNT